MVEPQRLIAPLSYVILSYLFFEGVVESLEFVDPLDDVRRSAVGLEDVQLVADRSRSALVIRLHLSKFISSESNTAICKLDYDSAFA